MRVVALMQGFYNNKLVEPGQIFLIRNDGDFSDVWMRPAHGETEKPVAPLPHKTPEQLKKEELMRQPYYGKKQARIDKKMLKNVPTEDLGDDEEEGNDEELVAPPKRGKVPGEPKAPTKSVL